MTPKQIPSRASVCRRSFTSRKTSKKISKEKRLKPHIIKRPRKAPVQQLPKPSHSVQTHSFINKRSINLLFTTAS
eukprot:c37033_g1_i1 orf=1-222(-)